MTLKFLDSISLFTSPTRPRLDHRTGTRSAPPPPSRTRDQPSPRVMSAGVLADEKGLALLPAAPAPTSLRAKLRVPAILLLAILILSHGFSPLRRLYGAPAGPAFDAVSGYMRALSPSCHKISRSNLEARFLGVPQPESARNASHRCVSAYIGCRGVSSADREQLHRLDAHGGDGGRSAQRSPHQEPMGSAPEPPHHRRLDPHLRVGHQSVSKGAHGTRVQGGGTSSLYATLDRSLGQRPLAPSTGHDEQSLDRPVLPHAQLPRLELAHAHSCGG